MVLLPCSKCCGPCWRCYRKPELEVCESQEITATLEVVSVSGFNGVEIDTSEETGMPVGTKLKLESAQPLSSSLCEFYFTYTSPTTGPCGPPFTGATNVGVYANLSGNQLASNQVYGRGGDAIFLGDKQLSCGGIPTGRGGGGPWDNAVWDGFGKHQFTVPIVDLDTYSVQIGEIVYEIDVIDLSAEDPDIPEDLYDYQCFDAPPTEDGWLPVGKCHPDEATCQAACPPDTTPPGGRTMTTTTTGPGTELANLLKWFNIHAKEKGCGCKSMQKKMDKGGPQWCRDHKDEILAHLEKEAKKRNLPFIRIAAEKLVNLAIRRAEKRS